jgi:hypothetical protein
MGSTAAQGWHPFAFTLVAAFAGFRSIVTGTPIGHGRLAPHER